MWVMQCMFPPSFPEFSRLNYESHRVWWIAPWLRIPRSGWFDTPKQMGVQSFNICRWWFRWDCLFPLLYYKLSWAQLYFFYWWFDNLAHWWYQSTSYKLALGHSPLLAVEKSEMGFLTTIKETGVLGSSFVILVNFFFTD